jgi:hypothetical protein
MLSKFKSDFAPGAPSVWTSMRFPAPAPGKLLSFEFAPEWLALLAVALIEIIWIQATGFRLHASWQDARVPCVVLATMFGLRLFAYRRGSLMAEYLALTLCMALVFKVFSYLCMAASGPLVDRQLLAIDRALGFDWLAGWHFLAAHTYLTKALGWLYNSLTNQALYMCLLLGLMTRVTALREIFWIIFLSAIVTNLFAIILPAYGPFEIFHLSSYGSFLPDMKHLKSGGVMEFKLSDLTGVICFPSFHTVMALGYAYSLRRTGIIGYTIAIANTVMLLGVPFLGGHYVIDMIAGIAVFGLATLVVRHALLRKRAAGEDPLKDVMLPALDPVREMA